MPDSVYLKVSSAFLIGGEIARKGEIVEVSNNEAKDLLSRGKATLATSKDAPEKVPAEIIVADEVIVTDEDPSLSTESIGIVEPAKTKRKK
jgi:hypothetical protein